MSLYPLSNAWDTKYVTVSNTWARKDTVTSYLTKYTLCTGSETKGGGRFFEAPLKMMIRKDSVVGWEGDKSPPPPSKSQPRRGQTST